MNKSEWKEIVARHQYDHLPLITGCLFAITIMLTLRDFLATPELNATWWYAIQYASIAVTAVIWVAAILKLIPPRFSHSITSLSLLCIGAKAGLAVWLWDFSGPGNIMMTLFAIGLVMLSMPVAIAVQVVIFLCWLVPAILFLDITVVASGSAVSAISAGLGLILLQRRVASLRHVFELEHRVETLESILPMCAGCKKTRDEEGDWVDVESYIESRDEGTVVTHGLCPECKESNYADFQKKRPDGRRMRH